MTREDNKISSQPEVELGQRDFIISPWVIATAAFLLAWLALGFYAIRHPDVQRNLTRFVPMTMEQHVDFRFRMALLALPIQPYYSIFDSVLDIIGGVLFAGTVLCASFSIAERAGVKPFARAE